MEQLMVNKTVVIRALLCGGILVSAIWMLWPKGSVHLFRSGNPDYIPVLVADRYIAPFSAIKPEAIRIEDYPKSLVPPGALHSKEELQNDIKQLLFMAAVAIPQGQPVTRTIVVGADQTESLTMQIRPGKVAVSFEVDKAHGVGGWIKPGDTIALFRSVQPSVIGRHIQDRHTQLLLPAVPVLAIDGKRIGPNVAKPTDESSETAEANEPPQPSEAKIVTVLVTPIEASEIIEAREEGSLSVILRATGDDYPWPTIN